MKWRLIVNFLLFQLGWFACLIMSWNWVLAISSLIIVYHLLVTVQRKILQDEILLLLKVLVIGGGVEFVYLMSATLIYSDQMILPSFRLLIIWLLFGTTLAHSLSWLANKTILSIAGAAILAPATYYFGANLISTISLGQPIVRSLLIISISWAIVFPLLLRFVVNQVANKRGEWA